MALDLPKGVYRIETAPPPGVRSTHAVGELLGTPVLALFDPTIPGGVGEWLLTPVQGSNDAYTITSHNHPIHGGWGYAEARPDEKVLFVGPFETKNWRIIKTEDGYVISVPGITGGIWAVTHEEAIEKRALVIRSYPVRDTPALPVWRFRPANEE
ncbi:hypothetical protein MD484_g2261, partial [Candolleomyces efflorescens]